MAAPLDPRPTLTLEPIGIVRSPLLAKVEAPRQPGVAPAGDAGTPGGVEARIELYPDRSYADALADLDGWDYIWVLFWFHQNKGWRPKVQPPRSSTRRGLFATRSPHRPNPLGLSAVRLLRVEGLTLHVADVDMLDGTPVLDIKPYVPYVDAHPAARSGWLDEEAAGLGGPGPGEPSARPDPLPGWTVVFSDLATAQMEWLGPRVDLPLRERIVATLSLGPEPHAYRRIRREGDHWRLAVQDWRAAFAVEGRRIRVLAIASGYRATDLAVDAAGDTTRAVHRDFTQVFGAAGAC